MTKKYNDLQEQGIGGALVSGIAAGLRNSGNSVSQVSSNANQVAGKSSITNTYPSIRRAFQTAATNSGLDVYGRTMPHATNVTFDEYGTDRAYGYGVKSSTWRTPRGINKTGWAYELYEPGTATTVRSVDQHLKFLSALAEAAADIRLYMTLEFSDDGHVYIDFSRGILTFPYPYGQEKIEDPSFQPWSADQEFRDTRWWNEGRRTGTVRVPRDAYPTTIGRVPLWARLLVRTLR